MSKEQVLQEFREIARAEIDAAVSKGNNAFAAFKGAAENGEKPESATERRANGNSLPRFLRALAGAKGDINRAAAFAADKIGDKGFAAEIEQKFSAMGNITGPQGGYLVPEAWANEIIPYLRAKSCLMSLGARPYPMVEAVEHIPMVTATTAAYWLGDTENVTVSTPTFGEKKLSEKYLAGLVPISRNLIRSASPAADAYVREDLVLSLQLKLDLAGIQGDGTGNSPRGIKYSGVQSSSIGGAVTADTPIALWAKLRNKNIPLNSPGFLFNADVERDFMNLKSANGVYYFRDEMMARKTLAGIPYAVSTQILTASSTTDIYCGDFSELLVGEREGAGLEVAVSEEAAYKDGSGNMQSAFSKNLLLVRAIYTTDILVRQDNAFVCDATISTTAS